MSRIRITLGTTCLALALAVLVTVTQAQGPGGGGGRGGRGGFGGPGGPGGFGGRGGGPYALLEIPAVQTELKLTDEQKAQLKSTAELVNTERTKLFAGMRRNRGNNNNTNNNNADPNAANNADPNPAAPPDPETMRANMQTFQENVEKAYKKVLTKDQVTRLKQLDLQNQGPMAVFRPEIAQKLNISDDQMTQMQEIQQGQRDQMKAAFQANRGQFDRTAFRKDDGSFDREALKKAMDTPEAKARQEQLKGQTDKLQAQTERAIGKVLTKNQKKKFNDMLGKPFDLALLRGQPATPAAAAATTDAEKAEATTTTPKAGTSAKKKGTAKKGVRGKSAA